MTTWHTLYITDKNGGKHFNESCDSTALAGSIRMAQRHIKNIKGKIPAYQNVPIDPETVKLIVDDEEYGSIDTITDSDIFKELFGE